MDKSQNPKTPEPWKYICLKFKSIFKYLCELKAFLQNKMVYLAPDFGIIFRKPQIYGKNIEKSLTTPSLKKIQNTNPKLIPALAILALRCSVYSVIPLSFSVISRDRNPVMSKSYSSNSELR